MAIKYAHCFSLNGFQSIDHQPILYSLVGLVLYRIYLIFYRITFLRNVSYFLSVNNLTFINGLHIRHFLWHFGQIYDCLAALKEIPVDVKFS